MIRPQSCVNAFRYWALALLLLLNSSGVAAQVEETNKDVPIQIRLKPDKKTIMLGEPAFFAFEVTNLSGEKLCLGVGADYRNKYGRPERFKVTVRTEDGKELPQLEVVSLGGFIGCDPIEPGEVYTVRLFLPHWAHIERTGSYRINVKRGMGFSNYEPSEYTPKYSFHADVNAEFEVVPSEHNKMGAIISSLGSIMLDSSDPRSADSAKALAWLQDDRVISYFAEALRKFRDADLRFVNLSEPYIRNRSIVALAMYDDDRAIEALQAAMNSPSEDTRADVAYSLSHSPHRSAFKLLLKMQDDSYYFVRLRVAQRLATAKTEESKTVLTKLLNDEHEDVREAAKESFSKINP